MTRFVYYSTLTGMIEGWPELSYNIINPDKKKTTMFEKTTPLNTFLRRLKKTLGTVNGDTLNLDGLLSKLNDQDKKTALTKITEALNSKTGSGSSLCTLSLRDNALSLESLAPLTQLRSGIELNLSRNQFDPERATSALRSCQLIWDSAYKSLGYSLT